MIPTTELRHGVRVLSFDLYEALRGPAISRGMQLEMAGDQPVDHRTFKMRAPPPGHQRCRATGPTFGGELGSDKPDPIVYSLEELAQALA